MTPSMQTQLFSAPQTQSTKPGDLGQNDESADNKIELKYMERKLAQEAQTGIQMGDVEEVLEPQYEIPTDSDFVRPPPLKQIVDPTNMTYKFLPK